MLGPGVAQGHQLAVERLTDAGKHLQGEVLVSLLNPGHRALASPEQTPELGLGEPFVAPGVPDEGPDPPAVVLRHSPIVSRR